MMMMMMMMMRLNKMHMKLSDAIGPLIGNCRPPTLPKVGCDDEYVNDDDEVSSNTNSTKNTKNFN